MRNLQGNLLLETSTGELLRFPRDTGELLRFPRGTGELLRLPSDAFTSHHGVHDDTPLCCYIGRPLLVSMR